ncbi:putative RNA polymerase II subunit B1 CTD phosphatase Rpap2 isoform X1 [Solenopsis invicta]|uniref:putative RNA polymerase II subunit B1 CTD phosphatase Rpap2 isoform X1 n=2 Tax=Solenopsis invicta TaxID=13686 RepID=UPI00193DEC9E|nr:putative RNA polymerase II subunit B1 CTD phosphatase Rpap2 isoform X1 [Solenopsis invicta]
MSATKQQMTEKQRLKKMSKAQMQLAIVKKKQCDAKALKIVEQLLESHVNSDWLLQNLGFISKTHMEDVIEERAIIKLCGYVLCSNQLTVIIHQQYHISTRKNKVYDISRRKNFCSSTCYGAANYLLEQMLESPLWLREKEDIPVFQVLPLNSKSTQCGDEIDVVGINLSQNVNANDNHDGKQFAECSIVKQMEKDAASNVSNPEKENICNFYLLNDVTAGKDEKGQEISVDTNLQRSDSNGCETHPFELPANQVNKNCDFEELTNDENNYDNNNIQQVDVNLENLEVEIAGQSKNILHLHKHNSDTRKNKNVNTCDNDKILQSQLDKQNDISEKLQLQSIKISEDKKNDTSERLQSQVKISEDKKDNKNEKRLQPLLNETNDEKMIQSQLDEVHSSNNTVISASTSNKYRKIGEANRINKNKKCKLKDTDCTETQNNIYHKLAMHIEQNIREWVTKNTLCLLTGEADEKNQLLEKLTQRDRYQQLCKKLNKLQLEDEKEDRVNLERNNLKPLPHLSTLQEDGKKMELKVRAFYEGRMTFTSEDSNKKSESKDNDELVLPLTDAHAPNALRRRIFLDNLNKILPDLMRALTTNENISSLAQCTYNNEKYSLIKILISTFNLSATNIIFKTAEWTLVGLIIIKMLSLIDMQLQSLLRSKQASMYMSMILTTYKLDSNYLDRLIMEITSNVDVSESSDK